MERRFDDFRFSTHFNRVAYMGMWPLESLTRPLSRLLFALYRVFVSLLIVLGIVLQMIDLYFVFGNLRKVTYNLCTSVIVIAIAIKVVLLYGRKRDLYQLRMNLWRDSLKLDSPQDLAIQDMAYAELRHIRNCFYLAAFVLLPIWVVSSYFSYKWGPRQLAFAGYIPLPDVLDDRLYVPALSYQAVSAFFVIFLVIEVDLAMFSLVLQMEAHYQILIQKILDLSAIFGEEDCGGERRSKAAVGKEVNPCLKKALGRKILKQLIIRHLEIIKYSKNFEHIYSPCMLLQVFAASFLVVMNGLELSMFLQEMSVKIYFQSGYVVLIVVDIFFICSHLTRLSGQSSNVGNAAYSTVWYKMDIELKRSLCMIMIRSQRPPRITAGKLFLLDLTAYLHASRTHILNFPPKTRVHIGESETMLRNIYSWLMLFRQLGNK